MLIKNSGELQIPCDSTIIIGYCLDKDRSCSDTMKRLMHEFNQFCLT